MTNLFSQKALISSLKMGNVIVLEAFWAVCVVKKKKKKKKTLPSDYEISLLPNKSRVQ